MTLATNELAGEKATRNAARPLAQPSCPGLSRASTPFSSKQDVDGRAKPGHDEEGRLAPFGWTRAAAAGLTRRPMTDADLPFLARLYASTRVEELAVVADWSEAQKATFLQMQFDAQHAHYQQHYAGADFLMIE